MAGCLTVASQASAASLGPSQGGVILGAPIDLFFEVQGDGPQASAENECVTAQVWLGDFALPSNQVRIIPRTHQVRLQTTTAVNEPLVTIKLTAGCASTITRSYTLFANPPQSLAAVQAPIDLQKINVAPLAQSSLPLTPPKVKTRPAKTPKAAPPAKAASPKPQAPATPEKVAPTPPAPATPPDSAAAAGKPTLRLNPVLDFDASNPAQPPATEDASPEAQQASTPTTDSATAAVPDPNAQRLEALEQQLQKLQTQLLSTHAETESLRTQLAKANAAAATPTWVYVLLGLLALALACIAWLLQRLKQEQARAQQAWSHAVAAQETPSAAAPWTQNAAAQASTVLAASALAREPVMPSEAPTAAAQFTGAAAFSNAESLSEAAPHTSATSPNAQALAQLLTAQALLEVQEEADFYASIGENDQAIALLEAHIAEHEKSSPLAYLELLQLLHRLSRTDAFERTREQFQNNFSVQVPSFLGFSSKGGDLLSSYPDVLGNIEAHWPSDAIQSMLRNLILNQNDERGDARFDLAAFDDLLMLYNVSRSTHAAERGNMQGRTRTTPLHAPLPEVNIDETLQPPTAAFMPDDMFFHTAPPVQSAPAMPPTPDLNLDFLSVEPTGAAPQPNNDSPFKDTNHFRPDEVLMDSLTLDWQTAPAAPAVQTAQSEPATPDLHLELPAASDTASAPKPPTPPTA